MPYTESQCRKFASLAKQGKKVPKDWKKYCTKDSPLVRLARG